MIACQSIKSCLCARKFLLLFSFALLAFSLAFGQSKGEAEIDAAFGAAQRGDFASAEKILLTAETDSAFLPYKLYLQGVAAQGLGKEKESVGLISRSIDAFDAIGAVDETYFDAVVRLILHHSSAGNWAKVVQFSRRALKAPVSLLDSHPLAPEIFISYAHALNSLGKYSDVSRVVGEGLPYVEKFLSPADTHYYELRMIDVVADDMKGHWQSAQRKIDAIDSISRSRGNGAAYPIIVSLREITRETEMKANWRIDAAEHLRVIRKRAEQLTLCPPVNEECARWWKQLFDYIIKELEFYYYDITSPDDERYWRQLVAQLVVHLVTVCDQMPGHNELAYDVALLTKNFLDYHSWTLHKKPSRWQDVRDSLAGGELAVEFDVPGQSIYLLGRDFGRPVRIDIPENIDNQIIEYRPVDAVAINDFFSPGSPLEAIAGLLEPYLDGVSTLFISPSNYYAQFNYSAIPFPGGGRLGDRVNVVQMTTTADIPHYKTLSSRIPTRSVALFGGMDFDRSSGPETAPADSVAIPEQMISQYRSGFGHLPFTLKEVEAIARTLPSSNTMLFTGSEASEERFKALSGADCDIVHIATHGYSLLENNASAPDSCATKIIATLKKTGLLMAGANRRLRGETVAGDDGILTSQEIASLDLQNVRLAVLSACSSGLGELWETTGVVYGVASAMKSAGVDELLVSLWDLPDEAAAIAMETFYSALASGKTSRQAVDEIKKTLISKGFYEPYYWAGYVVID